MIVAIHQPEYLPWPGFLNKMNSSDVFIILDSAQYSRGDFLNRNRIKTEKGAAWLTVPILGSLMKINEARIDNTKKWNAKHWGTIFNSYHEAPFFSEMQSFFQNLYNNNFELLVDLNWQIINFFKNKLAISAKLIKSSELLAVGKKTDLILDICKKAGGTEYLSGVGGRHYLEEARFEKEGIKLTYQNFSPPSYPQQFGDFIPNLSATDMVANIGFEKTKKLINQTP